MESCVNCGADLGVGRFCTNCGHPVGTPIGGPDPVHMERSEWRTDTSERPPLPAAPEPDAPPAAWMSPPPARFPLFADEADEVDRSARADEVDEADGPLTFTAVHDELAPVPPSQHRRPHRPRWLWVAGAVALVLVAVLGIALLTGGDDEEPGSATDQPTDAGTPTAGGPSDQKPGKGSGHELAGAASVVVPATAAPGRDLQGNPVDYAGENMLDGEPNTTWRMAGDGTGEEIVITLPEESSLRTVGLINGYAKQAQDRDWYHGNRRVQQVEWVFDDGTTVDQELGDTMDLQTVRVDTTTTTITLRLIDVSAPGEGPSRRDFTAISELSMRSGG